MACHKMMYPWQTMQETIDDLAGKISVKKRDNESVFRQQQEITKRNEVHIAQLRLAVKEAHRDLAKMLNMDYEVIQSALESKRDTQLECKRYDANTALKELNEGVCVEGKRLNHFVHQKECRLRRLQDLRLHYRDFLLLEESKFERSDQKRVRLLMTKLDKMIMKRNTASFIQSTYCKTVSKLDKDALTMHKHLDGVEGCVSTSKSELTDLSKIHRSAKTGQEISRAKRLSLEQDVHISKQGRYVDIVEMRKRAKEAAELPEFSAITRAPNDILGGGNKVKKSHFDSTSAQLEKLIPIIEIFGAITNTVNASDIPHAYERQIEHFNTMSEQCTQLEQKLQEKRERNKNAAIRLADAKYHQAEKMITLESEIEELKQKSEVVQEQTFRQNEDEGRLSKVMERVRDAIQAIVEHLIPTKVEGAIDTKSMTSTDSALGDQVEVIGDKLHAMQQIIIGTQPQEHRKDSIEVEVTHDQVLEVLRKLKTKFSSGVRITVTNEDDVAATDNFLLDDSNLNEHYISRDEIKKYGSGASKMKMKGKNR